MGLDMYIQSTPTCDISKVWDVSRREECYWRKANAIHGWFVLNVQNGIDDCGVHRFLTKEDVNNLINVCKEVLKTKDASKLPPVKGFFFGTYADDADYLNDIKHTVEQLKKLLSEWDDNRVYFYRSSW